MCIKHGCVQVLKYDFLTSTNDLKVNSDHIALINYRFENI